MPDFSPEKTSFYNKVVSTKIPSLSTPLVLNQTQTNHTVLSHTVFFWGVDQNQHRELVWPQEHATKQQRLVTGHSVVFSLPLDPFRQ